MNWRVFGWAWAVFAAALLLAGLLVAMVMLWGWLGAAIFTVALFVAASISVAMAWDRA